jgi:predicted adenylyl cyclase CyaB
VAGVVETESKHRIRSRPAVVDVLARLGFRPGAEAVEADEYYDTPAGTLRSSDMVVRLRLVGDAVTACFKGPRTYLPDGSYTRLEVELPAGGLEETRRALAARALVCVWRLQKRRREYRHDGRPVVVCLDELPSLGEFIELEGEPGDIEQVRRALGAHIGPAERLNYRELATRFGLKVDALAFPAL